jgi:hypothetical protein
MIDHAKILRVAAQRLRNGIPGTTTCGDALDEAADDINRLRMMNECLAAQLAKSNAGSVRLVDAAKQVLSWTDSRNRPPVRDELERGRSASVRVHALADLHDAVTSIEQTPNV